MLAAPARTLTLGHSPDPDDAFMFYGLAKDLVDAEGYKFEHILQDIQTLNERATRAELDITAISLHAYAYVSHLYALLPCGASMGDNYGPLVVARRAFPAAELGDKLIAVPGKMTSAYLALLLMLGREPKHIVVPFDQIMDAVKRGDAEAGLLIHEGQLTHKAEGLDAIVNLGEWWHERTGGLPLPLGVNAVKRDLGAAAMSRLNVILKRSIEFGLSHRKEAVAHSMQWGRGMTFDLADEFVGMYVNDLTLDFGTRGRAAVERFLGEAHAAGLTPGPLSIEFVE